MSYVLNPTYSILLFFDENKLNEDFAIFLFVNIRFEISDIIFLLKALIFNRRAVRLILY